MFQEERMTLILEHLNKHKRINVEDICKLFSVSRDTARRDLVNLEKQGSILRTHGGAILPPEQKVITNYNDRLKYEYETKRHIGKLAATLIKNEDTIIMDTSTTVQASAEFISANHCTVITNSINVADILTNKQGVDIHLLGGQLNHEHRFLYGGAALSMLSNYFADKVFLGALGLTAQGVTVSHPEDAEVMRKMIEQSKEVIILADHSKFGNNAVYKVAELKDVDIIITDQLPPKPLLNILNEKNINLIIVNYDGGFYETDSY